MVEPLTDELIEALRADATAEEPHIACCDSETVLRLLAALDSARGARDRVRLATTRWHLTSREASILALVIEGKTSHEIAAKLEVSRATVKWHMHNLFAKTGASSREGLLCLALRADAPPSEDDEPGDDAPAPARPTKAWF